MAAARLSAPRPRVLHYCIAGINPSSSQLVASWHMQVWRDDHTPRRKTLLSVMKPTIRERLTVLYNNGMEHIRAHLKRGHDGPREKKTERGELMRYFCKELNWPRKRDGMPPISMGRMGKLLEGIPTLDLYYLKSICDKSDNFAKKFWYELNPEKYKDKIGKTKKRKL